VEEDLEEERVLVFSSPQYFSPLPQKPYLEQQ